MHEVDDVVFELQNWQRLKDWQKLQREGNRIKRVHKELIKIHGKESIGYIRDWQHVRNVFISTGATKEKAGKEVSVTQRRRLWLCVFVVGKKEYEYYVVWLDNRQDSILICKKNKVGKMMLRIRGR